MAEDGCTVFLQVFVQPNTRLSSRQQLGQLGFALLQRLPEGRERSRMANWKHGRRSAAYIAERRQAAASLRLLRKIIAALQTGNAAI
jgi:hypothetical protein